MKISEHLKSNFIYIISPKGDHVEIAKILKQSPVWQG